MGGVRSYANTTLLPFGLSASVLQIVERKVQFYLEIARLFHFPFIARPRLALQVFAFFIQIIDLSLDCGRPGLKEALTVGPT
jgi:hypothetical protein